MASVRGLVEMADHMRKYGEVKKLEAPVSTTSVVFALTGINAAFEKTGKIGSQTWKEINTNCAKVEVYSGVDYTVEEPEMILYTDAKGYFNTDFMITGGYTFVISKDGYKKQSVYQPVIGYVQSTIKRIKMRREKFEKKKF